MCKFWVLHFSFYYKLLPSCLRTYNERHLLTKTFFSQDEKLQVKLQSKEKTATDLDIKNKCLKSEVTSKNKQIKELEKEVGFISLAVSKNIEGKNTTHYRYFLFLSSLEQYSVQSELFWSVFVCRQSVNNCRIDVWIH